MTHDTNKPDQLLNNAISALRSDAPGKDAVQQASARLWSRLEGANISVEQIRGCDDIRALLPAYAAGQLPPARALLVRDHLRECVGCRKLAQSGAEEKVTWTPPVPRLAWTMRQFATAAAVLVVLALSAAGVARWYFGSPAGMRARVQSVEGALYRVSSSGEQPLRAGDELAEGETIRTGSGAHAFVQLRDGSVVEINQRAELTVGARRKDTTVTLDQGRIIVQAAKRRTGHLYVVTPDCRVAVTGTVFAVNAGMKGSRVSVVEGEVHVFHGGDEDVLHSGEQAATSDSITPVPVRDEIAWSEDLDKHLALLAQFAILKNKIEQIPMPGLRYSSAIMNRVPANTVVFGSIPNLGDALNEANRIFQEQLQQSAVLRQWWESGHRHANAPSFNEMVQKLHALSRYLGDEIALVCISGQPGGEAGLAVIAEVRRPGLRELLQPGLWGAQPGASPEMRVVDEQGLATLAADSRKFTALVREDFVLFSPDVRALQLLNAQLNATPGAFAGTDFGHRVADSYARGAGLLIAFDLGQIIAEQRARTAGRTPQQDASFQRSGFGDARYLIAEHRDLSGTADNRAELDFTGPRRGITSWLAAPAPIGSLEFVSANAGVAVSFVTKSPALMLDDLAQIVSADHPNAENPLAELESKLNLNLREDLAAAFGGDATFALDGPILPKPSWKFVAEVYDPARVQYSFKTLADAVNRDAALHGRPGVEVQQENVQGRTFYMIHSANPVMLSAELHYTFADGYMIMAPSRALVISALSTKANADSLARSPGFKALLPHDRHDNCSALLYQNLAPLVRPIASQLTLQQLQSLQQIAAESKPSAICAYGLDTRIEVASAGRLVPFDLNSATITTLLGAAKHGTYSAPHP